MTRVNQVLGEIDEADARARSGESYCGPRHDLVPEDPQFEAPQPQMPSKNLIHQKRRQIIKNAPNSFKPGPDGVIAPTLGALALANADTLLSEVESGSVPMTLKAFALRLGVTLNALYNYPNICDRLSTHNEKCPLSAREVIEEQFRKLSTLEHIVTPRDFARSCNLSTAALYKYQPDWKQKLVERNRPLQIRDLRGRAEKHLQELIISQTRENQRQFATYIGIDSRMLLKYCPDLVQKLHQHNNGIDTPSERWKNYRENCVTAIYNHWNDAQSKGLDLTLVELAKKSSVEPKAIRNLCPELIPQLRKGGELLSRNTESALASAFAKVEKNKKIVTVKGFAASAGISQETLHARHRHWQTQLEQHNSKIMEDRLQETWKQMEKTGEAWSTTRFAKEAKMSIETLQKNHQVWINHLRIRAAGLSNTPKEETK